MSDANQLKRVVTDAGICGGRPCIRGMRIEVAVILDSMADGMSAETILEHFRQLSVEDVRAAIAYAAGVSRESVWKVPARQ